MSASNSKDGRDPNAFLSRLFSRRKSTSPSGFQPEIPARRLLSLSECLELRAAFAFLETFGDQVLDVKFENLELGMIKFWIGFIS